MSTRRSRRPDGRRTTLSQPLHVPVRRAFRVAGLTAHAVLPAPRGWVPLCMGSVSDTPMGSPDWRGWQTPEQMAEAADLATCESCARAIPARL